MKLSLSAFLVLLSLLLFQATISMATPSEQETSLLIFYSNDQNGETKPCG